MIVSPIFSIPLLSTLQGINRNGNNGHGNFGSPSFSKLSLCNKHNTLSSNLSLSLSCDKGKKLVAFASKEPGFAPFEEVRRESFVVPLDPQLSLSRQSFSDSCEAGINKQINVEYNVSYVYHAMFAYFDRDNIALKGIAKFFKKSSEEEREHAEKLIRYQNVRGGKVKLHSLVAPISEFDHEEKGDALYAMELALSLEKLTNEKLLNLHRVAEKKNDPQMADFIESEFLTEQVESIKKIAEYVAQLRLVGKGHGVWHFNQMLLREGDAA